MILATHGITASLSGTFVPDTSYQAILTYATTQGYTLPSSGQQVKQNQLVLDLKAAGIWNKLDTLAVFATDGNSNFGLIDWKRLSQYTAVNSPTFTTNQGFQGNGTSSYINTNFIPSTAGINFTLNNASRFTWISGTSANAIIDGNSTGNNSLMNKNATLIQRFNGSNNMTGLAIDNSPDGYKLYNRTSATNTELFVVGTQYSRTQVSVSLPTQAQWILASSGNRSSCKVVFYGMGASLVSENTSLYNALNTYLTSL